MKKKEKNKLLTEKTNQKLTEADKEAILEAKDIELQELRKKLKKIQEKNHRMKKKQED